LIEAKVAFRSAKADIRISSMLGEAFDPKGELLIHEHCRPRWSQAGSVVFITFRTQDSIPREVVKRWDREKQEWLRQRGADPRAHWSVGLRELSQTVRKELQKSFDRCRDAFLHNCHGRCLLKQPELAKIVANALLHFDGQRYRMGDFIVMPNHVHLLAVFPTADAMKEQCDSWLHFTAFRINQAIDERGKFWQQEPFDHLVRSPQQYEYLWPYIADNPARAGLSAGEFFYRRFDG
jgi:type I restriction enzyme R subunit